MNLCPSYYELFEPGCRIIVELQSREIFTGKFADGGKNHVVLAEPYLQNNNRQLSGFYEFYRNEILAIHKLTEPPKPPSLNGQNKAISAPLQEVTHSQKVSTIKLYESDYFRLKDMTRSFVYIENADKRYFDAVKVLSDAETIGVACPGMHSHRSRSFIHLVVMCTWKNVFIFDLTNVENRKMYPELKEILECEDICKVIHKSAGLVDILCRMYSVYIRNVLDTQVVDLMFRKTNEEELEEHNLGECLSHHLHLPSSLLTYALDVNIPKWAERPLSDKLKLYASQLVTYLIPLKNYFHKHILKDVYTAIDRVQDQVYDMEDFEFGKFNMQKKVPDKILKVITKLPEVTSTDTNCN